VINGQQCQIIYGGHCFYRENQFVYGSGNKVYWYNDSTNNFHLLYDFDAVVGDTLTIVPPSPSDSFKIVIDSITTANINGYNLRVQYYTQLCCSWWPMHGQIYELIGPLYCFFPYRSFPGPAPEILRCYEDSTVGLYNRNPSIACDSLVIHTSINELTNQRDFMIYPLPAEQHFSIKTESKSGQPISVNVYETTGRKIKFIDDYQGELIDIGDLKAEVYLVGIYDGHGNSAYRKLIKE